MIGGFRIRRALVLAPALVCLVLTVSACELLTGPDGIATPRRLVPVSDGWEAMGTFFDADLRVRPGEEQRAGQFLLWAREEIERLEKIYSRHDEASELSHLNRALAQTGVVEDGVEASEELEGILHDSIEVWEGTGGSFDITIGPLVDVWRGAVAEGRWPRLADLRNAKRLVGSEALSLRGEGKISVALRGLRIDLDGISKGVVLDRLRERFDRDFPGRAALISFGESSVLALGDPEGRRIGGGWKLEVHSRDEAGTRLATIRIRDRALAVSSSVGRVTVIDGRPISHIADPRTGTIVDRPVEAVVVSDRAGLADGWSTALLVLGAQRSAIRLVENASLEAYVFEAGGRIAATRGWEALEVRREKKSRS